MIKKICVIALLCVGFSAGCGSDGDGSSPAPVEVATLGVDVATQERCDPIGADCLLPLPNDHFTVADASTPTGRRLALSIESLPVNRRGIPINPADQNRGDGWSPGSAILVMIAGLDLQRSGVAGLVDAPRSLDQDAPIVLVDTDTGERHPYWAELDANADPNEIPLLIIHPARNFPDGHRIVVGLRHLADAAGAPIAVPPAFAAYRDEVITTDPVFESRRAEMEEIFRDLRSAGVRRDELQLAWDFTVASTESLTGRMIAIRDDAFNELGAAVPTYRIDEVIENPNPSVRRRVEGSFDMPLYLTLGGRTGGRLVLDEAGRPTRQAGTFTAQFTCNLPPASEAEPARMSLYGHGLLGDRDEVNGGLTRRMAADYNIVFCATNWYGMAGEDVQIAVAALADLSRFAAIPDRLQQGLLAFLYLGRMMKHPQGFVADEAFQFDGQPALKNDELYYDGNSQGAILGGALTAIAQDFTRAVLGEAGMNYSILLDRSIDFDGYLTAVAKPMYPRRYDRVIGVAVAQLLWDRGETNGYANHITSDPLPGTPTHQVLLLGAVGDQQVSEYSLRVEAATVGAAAHEPIAAPGRVAELEPGWLLPEIEYPHNGSAYYLWDTGASESPVENVPPREGRDPHDDTPKIPEVLELKNQFWRPDGAIQDPCGGDVCDAPIP